ncbi:MAG: peroxiredoxin [Flavobacteriaceae bacterium]|nr:peroxiredoxin [Flavobacteriaceae bacterium]|tara:strand:- start:62498 stop:63610 length:1113 start_codon:yes stop_codon:yes gene_type:complete
MKRLFYSILALLFLACGEDQNSFTLKGTAYGFEDGTNVFLYELDQNNQSQIIDTLVITNQKFEEKYPKIEGTKLNFLKVENTPNNIVFFVENENINAQIFADSLASSVVTGGRQNELYNEYLTVTKGFSERKLKITQDFKNAQAQQDETLFNKLRDENNALLMEESSYKRNFVKTNNNSLFSVMLLSELYRGKEFTAEETAEILEGLNPKIGANAVVTQLKKTLESAKKADIGVIAPNFEAPTPSGEMLSLNETLGKYTIIDFWASWCRPCRLENPNVVKVYEKYHDKGLNIISVSLDRDGQKERWVQAIEDDKMDWYHVSNLRFWQDPIAQQYNVRSIPATFLLDAEGRIIDKNLRGPALERRIAQLLD